MTTHKSLLRQHTIWISISFVFIELCLVAIFTRLVIIPLAHRAADDLAGLVVLSAKTWGELPPQTRPFFAEELKVAHQLEIQPAQEYAPTDVWHPPFVDFFEQAINRRLPEPTHLRIEHRADENWYWVNIPSGSYVLAVGWPQSRLETQPLLALIIGLLISLAISIFAARWLAKRILRPINSLDQAMIMVGKGSYTHIPEEDGPQELNALSKQFNLMAQQVRLLIDNRTTLFASISHDLRTPLTRMRLALELIKDSPSSELLERLEREIDRMNLLISQTMELARGLHNEPAEPIEIRKLLSDLQSGFKDDATPLIIECNVIEIWAPPIALQRVLSNLIQNAQRYATGKAVTIRCNIVENAVRLGVLDQGPGIPQNELERMQQPFERMESSRSAHTGGFGLGLTIVRELAKANGWQLQVESPTEGGLHVWITLPLAIRTPRD